MTEQDEPTTTTDLRKAAALLREMAKHYDGFADFDGTRFDSQHDQWRYWAIDREIRGTDMARWVSAMSPAVAEPLAAWLEETADKVDYDWPLINQFGRSADKVSEIIHNRFGHALDFARELITHTTGKATT